MMVTLEVVKKRYRKYTFPLVDSTGTKVSLSSCSVEMTVRDRPGGTAIKTWATSPGTGEGTLTIESPAADGKVSVTFTPTDFIGVTMPVGAEYVDLWFDLVVKTVDSKQVATRDGSTYVQKLRLFAYITEPV